MFIRVEGVSKDYSRPSASRRGTAAAALDNISLGIELGQMLALVGPSGSGKTTLLRCIGGLEVPDQGVIRIGDTTVFSSAESVDVPTEKRGLGLIFQSYALWPHMTVAANVAYPLKRRAMPEPEVRQRVDKYLELVGCRQLATRFPHELSGGQQQRIALARALVYEPAVVLFDEPLSNLDTALRNRLRSQIRDIQRSVGFTGVYVTHDQQEAFYVGDRVAILQQGALVQCASPQDIYRRPASARVAFFVGAENHCEGRLVHGGSVFESPDLGTVPLPPAETGSPRTDGAATLMIRPEAVSLSAHDGRGPGSTLVDRVLIGANWEYLVALASGQRWRVLVPGRETPLAVGQSVALRLDSQRVLLFPPDSQPSEAFA